MATLTLQVEPHPEAEKIGNRAALQVSWRAGDKVYPFDVAANNEEFGKLFVAICEHYFRYTIELVDKRQVCIYPMCKCPFDAPSDPNWCARGFVRPSNQS